MSGLVVVAAVAAAVSVWVAWGPSPGWQRRQGGGAGRDAGLGGVGQALPGTTGRAGAGGPPGPGASAPDGHGAGAVPVGEADVPLLLELSAGLLQAGQPVSGVLTTLSRVVPGCEPLARVAHAVLASVEWERAWAEAPPAFRPLAEALGFAHRSGAAAAKLLRTTAAEHRRASVRAEERRAAELGVRLVVPLGLCALPAFVCIGILPLVISMMPDL
ncbi:type II secretion system F family protein [Zhihengliuella sp.]|uniref:type II secretion system F family protein n=1 Tax=Zhihengliuella sp. TaxID=1954483 RepID=UPI002810F340|nr:type II secretion system F family protein [Zhihengliuella sp.]